MGGPGGPSERESALKRPGSATGVQVPEIPTPGEAEKSTAAALNGPENDGKGRNDLPPNHEFSIDYTDRRNRRWTGSFRAHVLTVRDRLQIGAIRARLSGNTPPHALDPDTESLVEILAHLTVAVDSAPEWMAEAQRLYAVDVLGRVYEEVAKYERNFWDADPKAAG